MAKRMYVGVNGLPRKIKKAYIGIDGKARKIKKGYISIDGAVRPVFAGGELAYYGSSADGVIEKIGYPPRSNMAAGTIGKHAIFAGGVYEYKEQAAVDSYNSDLARTSLGNMSNSRYAPRAGKVGTHLVIFGGNQSDQADVYDEALVRTGIGGGAGRSGVAVAYVGEHVLFAGGSLNAVYGSTNQVTVYDKNLTMISVASLSWGASAVGGTSLDGHAIFAGGTNVGNYYSNVETYDANLVKGAVANLSAARASMGCGSSDGFAVFFGGYSPDQYHSTVDAYSDDLIRISPTETKEARSESSGGSTNDYAIFAGGKYQVTPKNTVSVYDSSLVLNEQFLLSTGRCKTGATVLEDYIIFAGGESSTNSTYEVDAFVMQ